MPASAKPTGTKKNRVELCVRSLENGHDSVSVERLVSRCRINLIGPGMDDGFSVEVIEVGEDPRLEFFRGCDANAAEHGPRDLGEEAFDKIEPGTMFRGKHKGKAALWLGGKPGSGRHWPLIPTIRPGPRQAGLQDWLPTARVGTERRVPKRRRA